MEKEVFNGEELIRILTRRKNQLKKGETIILDKLRRKEKLSAAEFWSIFDLIRQEGPEVAYSNPNSWNNINAYKNN